MVGGSYVDGFVENDVGDGQGTVLGGGRGDPVQNWMLSTLNN